MRDFAINIFIVISDTIDMIIEKLCKQAYQIACGNLESFTFNRHIKSDMQLRNDKINK